MAALPYMQLYVADYLADTAHLSTLENGAYLLLIFNYWQRGQSFKDKDEQSLNKRLASVARLSNEEWDDVKQSLSGFFEVSENEWRHLRIDRDLDAVNSKSANASKAGKASAASRRNNRLTNAQQTLNHTDTDTDTDISTTDVVDKRKRSVVAKPESVCKEVWDGFKVLRKQKRSPITDLVIKGIEREAAKAGITLEQALTVCCEKGWQSFDASWLIKQNRSSGDGLTDYQRSMRAKVDALTGGRASAKPLGNSMPLGNVIDVTPLNRKLGGE